MLALLALPGTAYARTWLGRVESVPSARSLVQRLVDAHVCVRIQRVPRDANPLLTSAGMRGAWQCVVRQPPDGPHGGIEVGVWTAHSAREKTNTLRRIESTFGKLCSGKTVDVKTAEGVTRYSPAANVSNMRYVEGRRWLAFTGPNAPLRRVASVLGGRAVVRHCPTD
jgi:hypothetical protein